MDQQKSEAEVALELMRLVLDQAGNRRLTPTRNGLDLLEGETTSLVPILNMLSLTSNSTTSSVSHIPAMPSTMPRLRVTA